MVRVTNIRDKNKEYQMSDVQGGTVHSKPVKSAIRERASIFEKKSGVGFYAQEITSKKT